MPNLTLRAITQLLTQANLPRAGWPRLLLLILITLVAGGVPSQAQLHPPQLLAAAPGTAPQSLKDTLAQIDAAANKRDVKAVMAFYSQDFTHADGLTRQTLEQTLTEFWKRYNTLNYRTQLQGWKPDGNGFIAETLTTITGTQQTQNRALALKATIATRERIVNKKITRQTILSERSQITSGAKPPTVELNLPKQVKVGQEYNLDVIVKEPLGDSLLLGAVLEEPITPKQYLGKASIKLETLTAGGIFKVGKAPTKAASRWISAVLVREGGMTLLSQRLQVVPRAKPTASQPPGL